MILQITACKYNQFDGDDDDIPKEDKIDEYSAEYFEKWEKENTHW